MAGSLSLRIAHLIETDGPGGAERAVAHLATQLQASGHYNLVCLPARGEGWLARELAATDVAIEPIHLLGVPTRQSVRELLAALRRHRAHVAHSHEFTMAVFGAWAARRARIPHVITMHGSRYYAERWRRRFALRTGIALSKQVITVSRRLGDQLSRDLWMRRSHVATIPNGVPRVLPRFPTLHHELQLASTDRLLLAVGNLYPVKGHLYLLEALALLIARHPSVHLAIAGRGALEPALRSRASELGIGHRVHLLGLRSDVPDLLGAADVYVQPSLSEGLPLSLLEAMFAGRAIVATAVGDVPDALAGGKAGLLVEPSNAAALAAAITCLLDDPSRARALGVRAARRAAAEYGVSQMVGRYTALYCKLLRRRTDDRAARSTVQTGAGC